MTGAGRCGVCAAFTIVELIVVIMIIMLVLAIAIPGLGRMAEEARLAAAVQTLRGAFTRAHYQALADMNMTAVRLLPADWDREAGRTPATAGRQHVVTYKYVGTSEDPQNPATVKFSEMFVRQEGTASIELPQDVWVAPAEGLLSATPTEEDVSSSILTGTIGTFERDPVDADFFPADDFLVVFDPQTGVRSEVRTSENRANWEAHTVRATDLTSGSATFGQETDISRFAFSGIVVYKREPFQALGTSAVAGERRDALRRFGRPYFVHRASGELVMGVQ